MSEEFEIGDDIDAIVERFDELVIDDELERAQAFLAAALEEHPGQVKLRAARAELLIELDEPEEGMALIEELLEELDEEEEEELDAFVELLNLKAHAHHFSDEYEQARRTFNRTLRLDTEFWSALIGRATVHDRMGFLIAAMLDLDHAIAIDDQEGAPFALRAKIFLKRGQVDEAKRDFGYALDSAPYDEESRLELARIHARQGATGEAIELLEPLIEQGLEDDLVAVGALLRSQLSMALGSAAAAIEDAEVTVERWPDRPWGYLQRAACELSSMNAEQALESLKVAARQVKNLRDVPDIPALRASAYEQLDRLDKASRERAKVEGMARLPAIVYGPILNPARNVPINPDKPIDVRAIMSDLFGQPDRAPAGYEDALRDIIDQIPEIIEDNPGVERIHIELPQVQGMRGEARNLVIQVNQQQQAQAQPDDSAQA